MIPTVNQDREDIVMSEHPLPDAIVVDFDLGRLGQDPIVYARVNAGDLARLPVEELSVLGIGADMPDEGGDSIFFVGDEREMFLYVDTDDFPDFRKALSAIASSHGIPVCANEGRWSSLTDVNGEFLAPRTPGFVSRGYEKVEPAIALAVLEHRAREARMGSDDQRPELS